MVFPMSRLASLILLFALAAPFSAAQDTWHEVRSPHFVVLTDAGQDRGRQIALRFEQMRHVFGALLSRDKVNLPVPLLIIAFRSAGDLRHHLPLFQGKPISAAGVFISSNDRNFILLDASDGRGYEVIAHEYAHLLLEGNFPAMPPWFDEGFAEYFSTVQVRSKDFEYGAEPAHTRSLLTELVPVVELFSVRHDSPAYLQGGGRRSRFYSQSWLVVRYLFETGKLEQALAYCQMTQAGRVPVADAIRRAFGMEPRQLDAAIATFYRAGRPRTATLPMPVGLDNTGTYSYAARKVTALHAAVEIADLHLHTPGYLDQGISELENLTRQDRYDARAFRSLGYGYIARGEYAKAAPHIREALQLDLNDPRSNYYAALLVNSKGVLGGDFSSGAMRDYLTRAVDLDPSYADAWALLGFVYQVDEKYQQAADALLTALRLSPRNDRYRLSLAKVYLDAKRFDDAQALLAYLKESAAGKVSDEAAELLAGLEARRTAPARTGRFDERPRPSSYDDPKWRKPDDTAKAATAERREDESARDDGGVPKPDTRPIVFLKGTLARVACQPSGAARLTVTAGRKTLQLATPSYKKLVLVGADAFSCSWSNRPVAVNYRESSPTTGDLVSLELQ